MRLAVCSSKGGVGKSATAANLAAVLGTRGRVLAVDADPQDSLGRSLGVIATGRGDSLGALLADPALDPRDIIRRDVAPGVDLLPAHPSLEAVGIELAAQGGIVSGIRRVLRPLLADYDHIVLDTHGHLGNLTLSAVCAADSVLSVFTSDPGSALGTARVAAFVEQHRAYENTQARLLGVACALWDRQSRAARDVFEALETTGLPVLQTRIPASRRVASTTLAKRPVVLAAPRSTVALAYVALADELLAAYAVLPR
ncbi:MAG: Cobyrinic acid ac-diamide synthase [Frankiales bacterium]|nr:Cobyrinic acid ac-diamide synthase [Frankiales bacterium]